MDKRDLARLFIKEQNPHFQVLLTCPPLSKLEYAAKSHIILHCQVCGKHQKFKKVEGTRRNRADNRPIYKYECTGCGGTVEF